MQLKQNPTPSARESIKAISYETFWIFPYIKAHIKPCHCSDLGAGKHLSRSTVKMGNEGALTFESS